MKNTIKAIALILCLAMLIPNMVFAYSDSVVQNPAVSMPKASPVIDASIENNGAWSSPAYLNDATLGHFWDVNPLTSYGEIYFAYDDSYLYFAADITDNDAESPFVATTGYDDINNEGSSLPYGFNGDVLALMLDPLGVFEQSNYQSTARYCVGVYENGNVGVYRSNVNQADITSSCITAGRVTENGFLFEIAIPLSTIANDVSTATSGRLSAAKAALATVGSVSRASCMYMDRYITASGERSTWGRYITVCETTYDGYNGTSTNGVSAKTFGLTLNHTDLHEHIWGEWSIVGATCTEDGVRTRGCTLCDVTESEAIPATGHIAGESEYADATCTEAGYEKTLCTVCGEILSQTLIPAVGHSFGDWYTVTEATDTESGLSRRVCSACSYTEDKIIAPTGAPALEIEGYKVSFPSADLIKDMRFAPGVYSTPTEIKAAEGNIPIDNATITKGTVDNVYTYELPREGVYTLWIRMLDGGSYIIPIEIANIEPYLTAYGVKLTVNDIPTDTKDFFIAKGEYTSYSEIKTAGYIFNATSAKIAGRHSYTYTVYEDGVHTVLLRYNDGTSRVLHINLTVDKPVFTENGLQIIISNLPDVRVIRTAVGEYTTVAQMKASGSIRNFSSKTAIKGKDPYTVQYRDDGMVTVSVEYNNGYLEFYHYDVAKRVPTVNVNDSAKTVSFGNLDGLLVLRYAPGEYSTASEIKNAEGSQYIRPEAAIDGVITVTLEKGTYSFCVQYNDESYFYKTLTVGEEIVATAPAVNVSNAFSSNMMLQRDQPISVWGWGSASSEGKVVVATLGDMKGHATVTNGEWKITFPNTLPASAEPLTLTVYTSKAQKTFSNIIIGDVYYVIGQSNVFYGMSDQIRELAQNGGSMEYDYDTSRNMRFFRNSSTYTSSYTGTQAQGTATLFKDVVYDTNWMTSEGVRSDVSNPTTGSSYSALAYLFAYNMSEKTDVPIGVIEIDASGYPLISFAPNELAEKWGDESYNSSTGIYTYNLKDGYLTNPNMATRFAYNHLIYPLRNFCTAGIVWYQGESDCVNTTEIWGENADTFSHQFTELMSFFRQDFGNSDFPVYMIEFPSCYYNNGANAFIDMGGVQCEQGLIKNMLSNFHLVNSSDMFNNTTWYNSLHPYIKHSQAQRLADIVAANGYGVGNIDYVSGPVFLSASYSGNKATVTFANVGSGLKAYNGGYVDGFDVYVQINGQYSWVEVNNAYVSSANTVTVPSSYTIYGVRYNRNTEYYFPSNGINLCNSNNIPASAFIDIK